MATTTVKIIVSPGVYTTTVPFATPHGTVTAFNSSTGAVTWVPNTNYSGTSATEFSYEIFCDNVASGAIANVNIAVTAQTGVIDITNTTGGLPELAPKCGTINTYKAPIVFTPGTPAVSPIAYTWSTTTGFTISSGQGTDTVGLTTNAGFGGVGTLTITAVTPFETLTKTISLDAICATAVNDVFVTTANTPITFNISLNDTVCA
jgi:hypothetical protein